MEKQYPDILGLCREWLNENGFRNNSDSEGDLTFKYQMLNMVIIWNPEDPAFLRVLVPAIWSIENDVERESVLRVCNKLNMQRKVLKCFTTTNNTFLSAELLVQHDFEASAILPRTLEILTQGYHLFAQEMRASQN